MPRSHHYVAAVIAVTAFASVARAQTWNQTAAGTYSWNVAGNWTGGIPNGAAAIANVNNNIAGPITITLDAATAGSPINLNTLNLGDATAPFFPFTIAPGTASAAQFNGTAVLASRNAANV